MHPFSADFYAKQPFFYNDGYIWKFPSNSPKKTPPKHWLSLGSDASKNEKWCYLFFFKIYCKNEYLKWQSTKIVHYTPHERKYEQHKWRNWETKFAYEIFNMNKYDVSGAG